MKKFYEYNVHNICERIIDSIYNSRELLLSEDELFALATKMLWIEQDYANLSLEVSAKNKDADYSTYYRAKKKNNTTHKILDRIEKRAVR